MAKKKKFILEPDRTGGYFDEIDQLRPPPANEPFTTPPTTYGLPNYAPTGYPIGGGPRPDVIGPPSPPSTDTGSMRVLATEQDLKAKEINTYLKSTKAAGRQPAAGRKTLASNPNKSPRQSELAPGEPLPMSTRAQSLFDHNKDRFRWQDGERSFFDHNKDIFPWQDRERGTWEQYVSESDPKWHKRLQTGKPLYMYERQQLQRDARKSRKEVMDALVNPEKGAVISKTNPNAVAAAHNSWLTNKQEGAIADILHRVSLGGSAELANQSVQDLLEQYRNFGGPVTPDFMKKLMTFAIARDQQMETQRQMEEAQVGRDFINTQPGAMDSSEAYRDAVAGGVASGAITPTAGMGLMESDYHEGQVDRERIMGNMAEQEQRMAGRDKESDQEARIEDWRNRNAGELTESVIAAGVSSGELSPSGADVLRGKDLEGALGRKKQRLDLKTDKAKLEGIQAEQEKVNKKIKFWDKNPDAARSDEARQTALGNAIGEGKISGSTAADIQAGPTARAQRYGKQLNQAGKAKPGKAPYADTAVKMLIAVQEKIRGLSDSSGPGGQSLADRQAWLSVPAELDDIGVFMGVPPRGESERPGEYLKKLLREARIALGGFGSVENADPLAGRSLHNEQ